MASAEIIPFEPKKLRQSKAERDALFHTLNHLSAHAGHLISHLFELVSEDPRLNTPEWERRIRDYHKAWLDAQCLMLKVGP